MYTTPRIIDTSFSTPVGRYKYKYIFYLDTGVYVRAYVSSQTISHQLQFGRLKSPISMGPRRHKIYIDAIGSPRPSSEPVAAASAVTSPVHPTHPLLLKTSSMSFNSFNAFSERPFISLHPL